MVERSENRRSFSDVVGLIEGEQLGKIGVEPKNGHYLAFVDVTTEGRLIPVSVRITPNGVKRMDRNGAMRSALYKFIEQEAILAVLNHTKKRRS